ncbi:MAG: FIST N-terminal domain-containing protein [Sulfuricella sp.]|nr:FIST N-terminal domain-containing protein [Sulfuricella sp.]
MAEDRMQYLATAEPGAIRALLADWRAAYPEMGVLALVPEAEKDGVPTLQAMCRDQGVPLVGGIFPALVTRDGFRQNGLWLLRFDVMPPTALIPALNTEPVPPEEKIAATLETRIGEAGDASLFMMFDAMIPNIASILDALYVRLADRVHYMGVNAGSETFQPMPCLFDGRDIVGDGVLAILLPGRARAILEHGYAAPEPMIAATATEGNRIITIDWRPAFEVYQEVVRAQYGVEVNRDNFYQYATHFPFGIVRANNEIVVRIPVALEDDGSLFCVGEVPANAMLALLKAPEVDSTLTVETIVNGLTALNGPMRGRDLLAFYCAGRRMHLGERAAGELADLARRSGAASLAGALSLGEIGNSTEWGYPLFHNATLVCSAWGAR